ICNLVRVADEAVDFLVHEIDEHLAAALRENFLYDCEWRSCPSKRINERKGRNQSAVSEVVRVMTVERFFERYASFNDDAEIARQGSLLNQLLEMSRAVLFLVHEEKMDLCCKRRLVGQCRIEGDDR